MSFAETTLIALGIVLCGLGFIVSLLMTMANDMAPNPDGSTARQSNIGCLLLIALMVLLAWLIGALVSGDWRWFA